MCYRCEICNDVVKAGQPKLRHTVWREVPTGRFVEVGRAWNEVTRREVARELALCRECHALASRGISLSEVRARVGWTPKRQPKPLMPGEGPASPPREKGVTGSKPQLTAITPELAAKLTEPGASNLPPLMDRRPVPVTPKKEPK